MAASLVLRYTLRLRLPACSALWSRVDRQSSRIDDRPPLSPAHRRAVRVWDHGCLLAGSGWLAIEICRTAFLGGNRNALPVFSAAQTDPSRQPSLDSAASACSSGLRRRAAYLFAEHPCPGTCRFP